MALRGVGLAPAANLLYQAGTKMHFDDHCTIPESLAHRVFACGRGMGYSSLEQKLMVVGG